MPTASAMRNRRSRWRVAVAVAAGAWCGVLTLASCGVEGQFPLTAPTKENKPQSEAQAGTTPKPKPKPTQSSSPTPTPSLSPMQQPSDQWEDPKLPEKPPLTDPVLDQVTADVEAKVWTGAGERDEAETECDVTEEELEEPGNYDFSCTVVYKDVETEFDVTAESTEDTITYEPKVSELPVLEEKAVHEATRQAIDPHKVMCIMDDIEVVKIDDPTAIECAVTNIYGKEKTIYGELSENGVLTFTNEDATATPN